MDKRLRLALVLAWGTLVVMSFYDYDGRWQLLPLGVVMVGTFIYMAEDRLRRNTDKHTTLKLSGR